VIGILASRIREREHRPVIAFAKGEEGTLKGSARSVRGLHIRDVLDTIAARHPGLISKFGGHAMAAGLNLKDQDYVRFSEAFDLEVRKRLDRNDLRGVIESDGELQIEEFTLEIAQMLRDAGPWGQEFPEPLFDGRFAVVSWRIVGKKHLKLVITPETGEQMMDAIAFNQVEKSPKNGEQKLLAAYRMDVNEFRGETNIQLMIEYMEWL